MGYTIFILCLLLFFTGSLFTGGRSSRDVRVQFYGNYYAEDGIIDENDKPNSQEAFERCIDNGIGIKTEVHISADKRGMVTTFNDLSREYGVNKLVSDCTAEELNELGIMTVQQLLDLVFDEVPVILELKSGVDNENLCLYVRDAIRTSSLSNIAVCSFHSGMMGWFNGHAKKMFRGIVSAPAKDFKNLSKMRAFAQGNLANNYNCRPHFMLYTNKPLPPLVQFAATSGILKGVWTIKDSETAKKLEDEKELIVIRGFMPEKPHYLDLPDVEKSAFDVQADEKAQKRKDRYDAIVRANPRQRKISEILADDEEFKEEVAEESKSLVDLYDEYLDEIDEAEKAQAAEDFYEDFVEETTEE